MCAGATSQFTAFEPVLIRIGRTSALLCQPLSLSLSRARALYLSRSRGPCSRLCRRVLPSQQDGAGCWRTRSAPAPGRLQTNNSSCPPKGQGRRQAQARMPGSVTVGIAHAIYGRLFRSSVCRTQQSPPLPSLLAQIAPRIVGRSFARLRAASTAAVRA